MKVSVVTPTLNCAGVIEKTIVSVLSQTYPVEYIIVDGGSEDGTLDVANKYKDRIKIIVERGCSQPEALNIGVQMSSGDIFGWINADDYYAGSDVIATVVKNFDEGVWCLMGETLFEDEVSGGKIWRDPVFNYMSSSNGCIHEALYITYSGMGGRPSVFYKRDSIPLFRNFHDNAFDRMFFIEGIARNGWDGIKIISQTLAYFKVSVRSKTFRKWDLTKFEDMSIFANWLKKAGYDELVSIILKHIPEIKIYDELLDGAPLSKDFSRILLEGFLVYIIDNFWNLGHFFAHYGKNLLNFYKDMYPLIEENEMRLKEIMPPWTPPKFAMIKKLMSSSFIRRAWFWWKEKKHLKKHPYLKS